ncbi:hypothetical protein [Mangrovicoccus sp. HB161399]|uniref:hypothetical protein n=1 Tax=Mangrovicoccus sp. HB161399 TaxID=2720392 RepID=UPI0015578350|nr:hypothetical protein [Mangrovicoccus sp. HB161399]
MKAFIAAILPLGLAACAGVPAGEEVSRSAPNPQEQACLQAVTLTTDNGDVALLGSEFSEAGTLVRVGVGPDRVPWQCVAYADGSTAGVQSMSDEGYL